MFQGTGFFFFWRGGGCSARSLDVKHITAHKQFSSHGVMSSMKPGTHQLPPAPALAPPPPGLHLCEEALSAHGHQKGVRRKAEDGSGKREAEVTVGSDRGG